jgi:hypothetical protein
MSSASGEASDDHGFRSPQQGYVPPRAGEPPLVAEMEEASLSPRTPARPASSPTTAPASERKGWQPPGKRNVAPEAPRAPPAEPRAPDMNFDKVWPADLRAPQPSDQDDDRNIDAAPPVRVNGDATRHTPSAEPAKPADEPVTVLKSGVVDGMAYTLYTDGSIEAELAQGVVRFGSIEELRNHLEKSA